MKLKKLALTAIAIITITATGTCFAITKEDLNAGGIYLGQSVENVIAQYGQPTNEELVAGGGATHVLCYKKDNIPTIEVYTSKHTKQVIYFNITGENIATKAGVSVGSSLTDIKNAYGAPTNEGLIKPTNAAPFYSIQYLLDKDSYNQYYLRFELQNNKVTKIYIGEEPKFMP